MPKAKWGAGDKELTAADIDGAERTETKKRYSGPLPPSGTYRFVIQSLRKAESNNGNPMVVAYFNLDGSWMENHATYDGAFLADRITVIDSTKEKLANFLDAIGATGSDLLDDCLIDEKGVITKLGQLGDPAGILVYINVKHSKRTKEYPDSKLEVDFNGYIAVDEDNADPVGATGEPPF